LDLGGGEDKKKYVVEEGVDILSPYPQGSKKELIEGGSKTYEPADSKNPSQKKEG